jgi:hypothetical protein
MLPLISSTVLRVKIARFWSEQKFFFAAGLYLAELVVAHPGMFDSSPIRICQCPLYLVSCFCRCDLI